MRFHNLYCHENVIEMEVTQGDMMYGLNKGTKEWAESVLQALGITGEIEAWKIVPCRSAYISDYFSASKWEDRWYPAWQVSLILKGISKLPENILYEFSFPPENF